MRQAICARIFRRPSVVALRCTPCLSTRPNVLCFRMLLKTAIGDLRLETGLYWRYEHDGVEQSRLCGSGMAVAGPNGISINVFELLGIVVSA